MKYIFSVFCLLFSSLCTSPSWADGNGSSGIGNAYMINENLAAILPQNSIEVDRDEIRDAKSHEKLLQITPATEAEMRKFGDKLVKAKLGSVDGLEYIPNVNDAKAKNFWIVCQKKGECIKLLPLSKTNSKVPAIIGALSKIQKSR